MPFLKQNDLLSSFDGDLFLRKGDLGDTQNNGRLAVLQYIQEKLNYLGNSRDSSFNADLLSSYVGKSNTRELASQMAVELRFLLTSDGYLNNSDLVIDAFPLSAKTIAFKINVIFIDNSDNTINFNATKNVELFLAFDTSDGNIYTIDRNI